MLPPVINDQQAMECLGVCLSSIVSGKIDKPPQAHAACLLLDYSTQRILGPTPTPSASVTHDALIQSLHEAHAHFDHNAVDWPALAGVLAQLLQALGTILATAAPILPVA